MLSWTNGEPCQQLCCASHTPCLQQPQAMSAGAMSSKRMLIAWHDLQLRQTHKSWNHEVQGY